MIIGTKGDKHIFYGGLQGKRPDDAGNGTVDKFGIGFLACRQTTENGFHHIERRGANVAINYSYRQK